MHSPMLHTAQKLTVLYLFDCQIYIVGTAILSSTGTAAFYSKNKNLGGGIPGAPTLCMKP